MTEKSNVEILKEADALDDTNLSDEHKRVLNTEFTAEEMNTIIKMKEKIKGTAFKPDSDGAAL